MRVPGLTDEAIRQHTTRGSYERGQQYFDEGAVQHIEYSGQEIHARVKGSYYIPYAAHVSFNAGGITDVECTCPYHEGSWCKHIVATLLTVLQQRGEGTPVLSLRDRLHTLDREQLIDLIDRLAASDPSVVDEMKRELNDIAA